MTSLGILILTVLRLYTWVVIIAVIMSWLLAFNVINARNDFVNMVMRTLYAVTEPVLGRIRSVLPAMGGLDLSPLVLILGIFFLQMLILEYWPGLGLRSAAFSSLVVGFS